MGWSSVWSWKVFWSLQTGGLSDTPMTCILHHMPLQVTHWSGVVRGISGLNGPIGPPWSNKLAAFFKFTFIPLMLHCFISLNPSDPFSLSRAHTQTHTHHSCFYSKHWLSLSSNCTGLILCPHARQSMIDDTCAVRPVSFTIICWNGAPLRPRRARRAPPRYPGSHPSIRLTLWQAPTWQRLLLPALPWIYRPKSIPQF